MKTDLDEDMTDHAVIYRVLRRTRVWMSVADIRQKAHWLYGYYAVPKADNIPRRISDLRNGRYGRTLHIQKKKEGGVTYYRIHKKAKK